MARDLHVVLGASGGTGSALVRELVARGHRVRAVNRRGDADVPDGVERLPADISTADGAREAAGRLRVTMGRSSDYYGPRGTDSIMGDNVMPAVVAGRTARWPGPLDVVHTWHFLPDMARALVTLGERADADGRAWHLPAAEPLTARQLLDLAFRVASQPPKISRIPTPAVRAAALVVPLVRELRGIAYQHELPFVIDATGFEATFGPFAATPHDQAIAETVAWYRSR